MRIVVRDQQGFNRQPSILTGAHFTQLLEQFGQWAHFRNHARYVTARGAERELLLEAARDGASFASETIESLRPWSGLFGGFSAERTELKQAVVQALSVHVFDDLLARFSRKDGISALWGKTRHLVEKYYLFRRDGGFYNEARVARLKEVADQAKTSLPVQENFYEYVRLLASRLLADVRCGRCSAPPANLTPPSEHPNTYMPLPGLPHPSYLLLSPCVPVCPFACRETLCRFKVRARIVGHRQQGSLGDMVGNPQERCRFLLVKRDVYRGPCRSYATRPQGEHERPCCRENTPIQRGRREPRLDAWDDEDRHFMEVIGEINKRVEGTWIGLLEIRPAFCGVPRIESLPVEVSQPCTLGRVSHHHEVVPRLIATGRCLNGDFETFLDDLGFDRTRQVQALAHRARRGKQLVNGRKVHGCFSSVTPLRELPILRQ